ncbi:u6 snrnaassociated sm-like protein lsm8, putative [Acanthamoeba castellanii str. Neff]|uniref:U6 snRNA-associated Sm-like protein LSm8 n=1 Tax=Acanthamoeba castellanii (strain ATCC 30010 / Neff) TaxID=1257118 RepID=L8HKS3_ACACF|nr:u6 snrnaassociated sm-like protein lsm8, putative [Acanthamoeba castellanii str. Neff]ELR25273.1 u6 snrnaassociated sm-like protein lsm8, putative [Acanthamoeba castellanii str. Neff]
MLRTYNEIDRTVSIITSDARSIVGTLRGFDQFANVIVEDSHERVYSAQGMEKVPLGLYVIRGDNIAVIGELNEQLDKQIDFSSLRAQPLQHVLH